MTDVIDRGICEACGWHLSSRWLTLAGPDGRWVIVCVNPDCDESDI